MARPTNAPRPRAKVSIFTLPSGRFDRTRCLLRLSLLRAGRHPAPSRPPRLDSRVEDRLRTQRDAQLGLPSKVLGAEARLRLVQRDDDWRDPGQVHPHLPSGRLRGRAEPSGGPVVAAARGERAQALDTDDLTIDVAVADEHVCGTADAVVGCREIARNRPLQA